MNSILTKFLAVIALAHCRAGENWINSFGESNGGILIRDLSQRQPRAIDRVDSADDEDPLARVPAVVNFAGLVARFETRFKEFNERFDQYSRAIGGEDGGNLRRILRASNDRRLKRKPLKRLARVSMIVRQHSANVNHQLALPESRIRIPVVVDLTNLVENFEQQFSTLDVRFNQTEEYFKGKEEVFKQKEEDFKSHGEDCKQKEEDYESEIQRLKSKLDELKKNTCGEIQRLKSKLDELKKNTSGECPECNEDDSLTRMQCQVGGWMSWSYCWCVDGHGKEIENTRTWRIHELQCENQKEAATTARAPTEEPIEGPTKEPTEEPVEEPTEEPTEKPIEEPMEEPIEEPTAEPITEPTKEPSAEVLGDIRLNFYGHFDRNYGLLEVFYNGQWGTICDDRFSRFSAHVACRQLGYTGKGEKLKNKPRNGGVGKGPIWMEGVRCRKSTEKTLLECDHTPLGNPNDCYHEEDVNLLCFNEGPTAEPVEEPTAEPLTDIRLNFYGIFDKGDGRLEVYHDGEWGTVCEDDWDRLDTKVACRQLGYANGKRVKIEEFGEEGTGRIWLDDVDCKGEEKSLFECKHLPWNLRNDCYHGQDIALQCFNE